MTANAFDPKPVTLEGAYISLAPIELKHAEDLYEAGRDPAVWRFLPRLAPASVDEMTAFVEEAFRRRDARGDAPFAIVHNASGKAIGSTSYLDVRKDDRGLEIGWTWIGPAYQRTAVNTECKYLLLRHAFDDLGAERVCLKTDARNLRSQAAIERIGAKREGVLRRHMICPDGFIRDTVYFSIIRDEWEGVKQRLESILFEKR